MPDDKSKPIQTSQAVFSVCATHEVVVAGTDAVAATAGSLFAGEFHDYITADRRPQFAPIMKDAPGCVALIDCDRNPELALETMERLQEIFLSKLNIVAISSQMDSGLLLRAMRAGCNDVLSKPVDVKQLATVLVRFQNRHIVGSLVHQGVGRIISFFGAKGGVGTTTLAVHLAMHLVRRHHKRTLLIDHRHELGHVALYLGLRETQYFFGELIRNVDRLDADLLNGLVTKHVSGLEVLASPDTCAPPHKGAPEEFERVMKFLQRQYDYILIDSSVEYKEALLALLHCSDEVCMISTPDLAALRDLARHVEHLSLSDSVTGKLRIIINRSTSNDAVSPEEIEKLVRFPVAIAIPNNYADLIRAINAGEPISPQQRSAFAQQIGKWASKLQAGDASSEQVKPARKLFSLWG
jgi:pilus assembly protein CpaE